MIIGFGSGGVQASLSEDRTYVEIITSGPQPTTYRIRIDSDNQLEIINMDDDAIIMEEIEQMITPKVFPLWDHDYGSYELRGIYEAAENIVKYIRENFVRKN